MEKIMFPQRNKFTKAFNEMLVAGHTAKLLDEEGGLTKVRTSKEFIDGASDLECCDLYFTKGDESMLCIRFTAEYSPAAKDAEVTPYDYWGDTKAFDEYLQAIEDRE